MTFSQNIHRLKEDLDKAEHALVQQARLGSQREELAQKLRITRQEAEDLAHQKAQGKQVDSQGTELKLSQVKELEKHLQRLDHELDEVDQILEISASEVQAELIDALIQVEPSAKKTFQGFQDQVDLLVEQQRKLQLAINTTADILTPLSTAHEARRTARSRGWLNLIFGRHPNVIIAQYLGKAKVRAENTLLDEVEPLMNPGLAGIITPWQQCLQDLVELLDSYHVIKHMDTKVAAVTKTLEEELHALKKAFQEKSDEVGELEKKTKEWIDHYCSARPKQ